MPTSYSPTLYNEVSQKLKEFPEETRNSDDSMLAAFVALAKEKPSCFDVTNEADNMALCFARLELTQ